MTVTQRRTLPVELHDMILNALLNQDGKSARPLSTVCQHWRMRLYKSIFTHIYLDQFSAISFSRLLACPFSRSAILPSVRTLHLNANSRRPWSETGLISIKHLLVQFSQTTNINTLVLSDVGSIGDSQLDLSSLSLPSFRSVDTVKLCGVVFEEPSGFKEFFRQFPALNHAEFIDVLCPWANAHWSKLPPGEFTLKLVVHSVSSHRTSIRWTLTDSISSIDVDDLCSLGQLTTADMPTLLRQIGPVLRELDVDFQPEQMHGQYLLPFLFTSCETYLFSFLEQTSSSIVS